METVYTYKTRWHALKVSARSSPPRTRHGSFGVFLSFAHRQNNSVFLDVGNRSGKMDLAALGAELKSPFGSSDGAIVLCWKEETEVLRLLLTAAQKRDGETFIRRLFKAAERKGGKSHQVDVENGAVVAVDVRVHGALLRCQTDSAVLQGEGGVGRHVVPGAHKRVFKELADALECVQLGGAAVPKGKA